MKCPYCNKEMKKGFVGVTGRGEICWTNEMVGYGAPQSVDGFFQIGKAPYLRGSLLYGRYRLVE